MLSEIGAPSPGPKWGYPSIPGIEGKKRQEYFIFSRES